MGLTDWLNVFIMTSDKWQTADEITMHDRYSLSNKINYSLQFTVSVFELVWISVQQPSYNPPPRIWSHVDF